MHHDCAPSTLATWVCVGVRGWDSRSSAGSASLDARVCSCMAPPTACRCDRRSARDVPRIQKSRQDAKCPFRSANWRDRALAGSYTERIRCVSVASVRAVSVCRSTAIAAVRGTLSTRRSRAASTGPGGGRGRPVPRVRSKKKIKGRRGTRTKASERRWKSGQRQSQGLGREKGREAVSGAES
jgi:hypothetical protein